MTLNTPNYTKTVMYKIISKDNKILDTYIGHTTNIKKRISRHRENVIYINPRKDYYVYQFIRKNGGWDNFELIIIEEYPCQTCDDARLRERYWYELLKPSLNSRRPIISKKEYCEINKDKKREYDIERRKLTFTCECGNIVRIARKSEHLNSNHTKRIVL